MHVVTYAACKVNNNKLNSLSVILFQLHLQVLLLAVTLLLLLR